MNIAQTLKTIFIFKRFTDEQLEHIARFVTPVKMKKGEILFVQGENVCAFFAVAHGRLSVFRSSKSGLEQTLHIANDREVVAEAAIFGKSEFPASCKALKDSLVLKVPRGPFIEYMMKHPEAAISVMAAYSIRLREFVTMIEYLSLDDVKLRVIKYLQRNCRPAPDGGMAIELTMSKKELAGLLGTAPETLSRTLKKLKEEKHISEDGKLIRITDPNSFFSEL
ncbi:MAG: Crp/Fnr family transcriptional regulator [Bacteriovoracaceae bacterium]|nr:Crp/Fnr family transcriptional regulator [Bacteriovoracaceae bacterium]